MNILDYKRQISELVHIQAVDKAVGVHAFASSYLQGFYEETSIEYARTFQVLLVVTVAVMVSEGIEPEEAQHIARQALEMVGEYGCALVAENDLLTNSVLSIDLIDQLFTEAAKDIRRRKNARWN